MYFVIMRKLYIAIMLLSTSVAANATEEVYVINENGDKEIYTHETNHDGSSKLVSTGMLVDIDDTVPREITVDNRPSVVELQSYAPASKGNVDVIITKSSEYEQLIDKGGEYDASGDVYNPDLGFNN